MYKRQAIYFISGYGADNFLKTSCCSFIGAGYFQSPTFCLAVFGLSLIHISSARTFVFVREIEPLLGAGLIKGGDLDLSLIHILESVHKEVL